MGLIEGADRDHTATAVRCLDCDMCEAANLSCLMVVVALTCCFEQVHGSFSPSLKRATSELQHGVLSGILHLHR